MRRLLALLALIAALPGGETLGERVVADPEAGLGLRVPRSFLAGDACGRLMIDVRAWQLQWGDGRGAEAGPWSPGGVRVVTVVGNPEDDPAAGLARLAGTVVREPVPVVVPAGDGVAAPPAWRAICDRGRLLGVRLADRWSGVLIGRQIEVATADAVLASVEVLATVQGRPTTARERACRAGGLFAADGTVVTALRPPAGVHAIEGARCRVFGTAPPAELRRLATHLDDLHAALTSWLPPPSPLAAKFEVRLWKTAEEFRAASGGYGMGRAADASSQVQGFFSMGDQTVYAFTEAVARSAGTAQVRVSHESVHQYLHLVGRSRLPQWFDEGMAVLWENGRRVGRDFVLDDPALRLSLLKSYYRQHGGPIAPLADYLGGTRFALNVHQYAEVGALVHLLTVAPKDGRTRLAETWSRIVRGEAAEAAITAALLAGRLGPGGREQAAVSLGRELVAHVTGGGAAQELRLPLGAPPPP